MSKKIEIYNNMLYFQYNLMTCQQSFAFQSHNYSMSLSKKLKKKRKTHKSDKDINHGSKKEGRNKYGYVKH